MESQTDLSRREKRKAAKKLKRKQIRREAALKERAEEEARLNDPEEQLRIKLKEQEEAEILERQRKEFEEHEKLWLETAKKAEEEAQRRLLEESQRKQVEPENELEEDDAWEYIEEGPAEIIWEGNEIIVKKKRIKVPKKSADEKRREEDADRPTSNPLPPQSEAFAAYRSTPSSSAQNMLESVAQQIPNFGTEQDKAHCPFHLKTGACRFGPRCSRIHFYPDKSCTLLIKNMYNGPGLAWEQDEGLECTDEEVERCFEEFYEDVHTEFLKFGEIVNFKVCKNGSSHLRGNVYVHYKSLESAVLTYNSINGRYFAGKQITCEFVGVTRWKVAICGEYMKSRLKTCSRGTACNFIHCFRNPGGDYEWADWDYPPPRYWVKKMAALFGPSDEFEYDRDIEPESQGKQRNTGKHGCHSRKLRSKDVDWSYSGSGRDYSDEYSFQRSSHSSRQSHLGIINRKERSFCSEDRRCQENIKFEDNRRNDKTVACDNDSGEDHSDRDTGKGQRYSRSNRRSSCHRKREDLLDDRRKVAGKHRSDEPERYERKDKLLSHDAHRKYSDRHGLRNHGYSSSSWHSRARTEEADSHDEHSKSEDSCEFDSPGQYDQRWKSHDQGSSHYSDETIDRHSGETETRFFDEHEEVTREYSFDENEKNYGRYKSSDSSGGKTNKTRSRSRRSSHRSHSASQVEGRDSSDGEKKSEENFDRWKHRKNQSNNQELYNKKNKSQKQETNDETTSSIESVEKSGCEQEESCNLERWSPSHCSPFDPHKCGDGVVKSEDVEDWKNHRTRRKRRHHREEEEYEKIQIMEKRASRKRSRSRSPVQDSGRSRRERSWHRGEES
ncbi:zinc finger CCCH domain-containing protein 5 isoform X2 [Telopea speciosissima]|uniref:zinc finger CCCH domain-containing protein 5 isoform X2 n=1 Tax=Telopea speciosissima TaxID=54955 RepID=UPI001CC6488E|nr:zinc finger CCCH domain-containing protein 5 isoform X2 [Telopea speciosissima]